MEYSIQTRRVYGNATGRDLHIDGPLSNITTAYRPNGMIADMIFPTVPVAKETDAFYQWTKADFLRVEDAHRARNSEAKVITTGVSSSTYVCLEYSLRYDVPLQDLANADDALSLRETYTNYTKDKLMLAYEDRVASLVGNTTNVGTSTTLGANWDDPTTSPLDTINNMMEAIRQGTGYDANLWVISKQVANRLGKHPDVIDFVRGKGDSTGQGFVQMDALGRAFGVDRVLIGKTIKNTAAENATGVFTDVWSTTFLLAYVAPTPGKMIPTYGYTFQWTPAGMPGAFAVERYMIQEKHVEALEVSHYQDEIVIGTDLGALILGG